MFGTTLAQPDLAYLILAVSPTLWLFILIVATLVLVLSHAWRIALLALLIHYLALGGLVLQLGPAARSGLRILMGGLICLVLFLTARRLEDGRRTHGGRVISRTQVSAFVFRLAAVALAGVGVFGTSIPVRFPSLPAHLVLASAWLAILGLVVALISRAALWAGIGLVMAESGFETLYTALDPRLMTAGLLAMGSLLLALAVAVVVTSADQ
ncbi:MAG: hypothetical protein ACE5HA_15870, partial [Anaerolineae bacterium]